MLIWLRSWKAIAIFTVLLPPLGLLLLLFKPTGVYTKVVVTLMIAGLSFVYLKLFFGLKVEMDGSSLPSIVTFRKPEEHYARIEQSRAETAAKAPPTVSEGDAPVEPVTETAEPRIDWADYRGPDRAGIYKAGEILTAWPAEGLERLWKQPVGEGYASFSIAKGIAYTIEQRRTQEVLAAYDIHTGRELWTQSWDARFTESLGGDGPRATPIWHSGRVYALGAEGELRCLNGRTGKTIWSRNVLEGGPNLQWGMAASPLIVDEKVVVSAANRLIAYNRETGEPVWRSAERQMAYVSPMLVTLAGRRQILHVSAFHALGVSPEDGTVLWDHAWGSQKEIKCAQPIVLDDDRVFFSAGYGIGALVVEIDYDGRAFTSRTLWENNRMKNKFSSAVLRDGYIYGMDEAILACIDPKTGDLKWKGGRYGYGQVIAAGDRLIVLTEAGELVLVKATPEGHQELARFAAIEGKTWNNPAISDGLLLVRNANEMACFRIGR
jgi:outer membrane protein assembly factor BamB